MVPPACGKAVAGTRIAAAHSTAKSDFIGMGAFSGLVWYRRGAWQAPRPAARKNVS
jgi:hypothetical protein